jgi:hypothetical protein
VCEVLAATPAWGYPGVILVSPSLLEGPRLPLSPSVLRLLPSPPVIPLLARLSYTACAFELHCLRV